MKLDAFIKMNASLFALTSRGLLSKAFAPRCSWKGHRILKKCFTSSIINLQMSSNDSETIHQSVWADLESVASNDKLTIIVLNNYKRGGRVEQYMHHVWQRASVRICADGGANQLYDSFAIALDRHEYLPDIIKGDLDSLRPDVQSYYEERGTAIICDSDQNHNDFEKCLKEAISNSSDASLETTVVAFDAFGGRFDQEMASFHLLHKYMDKFKHFVLLGEKNVSFLISPGKLHKIFPSIIHEGPSCGLIPMKGPCNKVTTTGLKWNMKSSKLAIGEFVSSSNQLASTEISVITDAPLVWCIELKDMSTT